MTNLPAIDVWTISLDLPEPLFRALEGLLSPAERERADKIQRDEQRRRWIASRGALRKLLGDYVEIAPERVDIRTGEYGKPFMLLPNERPAPHFNLSHSGTLAMLALTWVGPVGIDLEQIRELAERDRIARKYFDAEGGSSYWDQPDALRTEAFFSEWTRREAYVKGLGMGLRSLGTFPQTFAQMDPRDAGTCSAQGWAIRTLTPAPGYVGALAYPSEPDCALRLQAYPEH